MRVRSAAFSTASITGCRSQSSLANALIEELSRLAARDKGTMGVESKYIPEQFDEARNLCEEPPNRDLREISGVRIARILKLRIWR